MKALEVLFKSDWSNWVIAALILIIGYLAIKIVLHIARKALEKSKMDPALYAFTLSAIKIIAYVALIVAVFSELGIDTKTFLAVMGAAGAAIAIALKDSLSNVAGGIIILLTNPFSQGDYIDIIETEGNVEKIDIITTTLKTNDNKIVKIPNGKISTSILTNYTRSGIRRVDFVFGVDYSSDLALVKRVLLDVAANCVLLRHDKDYFVGVGSQGESAINIDFRVWCDVENYWDAKYYIEEQVKLVFDENHITIPYPHMEVSIKKD